MEFNKIIRKFFKAKTSSELPQEVVNGQVLYAENENTFFIDTSTQRIRVNPPSDWQESNITSPSYIANKPTFDGFVSFDDAQIKSDAEKLQARSNIGAAASSDLQITNGNVSSLRLDFENAESWKDDGEEGELLSVDSEGQLVWISLQQRFNDIDSYLSNLNVRVNRLFIEHNNQIWLENVGESMDIPALLSQTTAGTNVRVTGLDMEVESAQDIDDFYNILDTMHGLSESGEITQSAQISGTISIYKLTPAEKTTLSARYPNITIDNEHFSVYKYFYSEDGTQLVGSVEYVDGITTGTVPNIPAKQQTAQYTYTAKGWSITPNSSEADADVSEVISETNKNYYAVYTANIRSYTIKFARGESDGNNVLQTSTLQYGTTPAYSGVTPTTTHGTTEEFTFIGWNPEIEPVHGNATYYAVFQDNRPLTVRYLIDDIDTYQSDNIDVIASYGFNNKTSLKKVETSATTIKSYAFSGCTNLTTVDLTNTGPDEEE